MKSCTCYVHTESPSPGNLTVVMPIQTTDPGSDPYLNIVLCWDDQQTAMNLDQNYTITIFPPVANSGGIFHTFNTSIQLALPRVYDQDYNIRVVASNCIGNSTPAKIRVRLIGNCSLRKDGVLINYCLPEITAAPDEMMVNKSTSDSSSDLGPQQHGLSMPQHT